VGVEFFCLSKIRPYGESLPEIVESLSLTLRLKKNNSKAGISALELRLDPQEFFKGFNSLFPTACRM